MSNGKEMAVSSGGGKSGGGVTGGAKRIITLAVGFFVLMMVVPHLGAFMDTAGNAGASVLSIVQAIAGVLDQIAAAFASVGGGQ